MATKKSKKNDSIEDVKVVKGSHLTVYTYPDGSTRLEWDDEALTRDVQQALASVEGKKLKPAVKAKVEGRAKKIERVAKETVTKKSTTSKSSKK